ncbi:IS1634 family transposase [candidate division WOR-3 bacterium]|nr:IS1634 family transposase [candidate division WOR-3 bacterium]
MHLVYGTRYYKKKKYTSYSIAESYREGKKVRKRKLFPLGKLSETEVEQIKLILKVVKGKEHILSSIENIIPLKSFSYLEVAVANQLWEDWQIDQAFDSCKITNSPVSTPLIARVLTINRCLKPTSCYSIEDWVKATTLPQMLDFDPETFNDDKLYYELDKIEANKEFLENFLFTKTYQLNRESYNYINYDLTTSYFIGIKCSLSQLGKSKDNQPHRKQVILAIMVNEDGYPFKWDVLPGNTAEVTTLEDKVKACKDRFHLKGVSLVFDRGVVSENNLQLVDEDKEKTLKYLCTLDKNQIPKVEGVNLQLFKDLTIKNIKEEIESLPGFTRYDELLYYQDLGEVKDKRYILGINPTLFIEGRSNREEKIKFFTQFIHQFNQGLQKAKRERSKEVIKNSIKKELARLKITRFFEKPRFSKINLTRVLSNGSTKRIPGYKVSIKKKEEKIKEASLLDGVCCFVTNHTEEKDNQFLFPPEKVIYGYRNKRKIEDAFKHLKSFLKIRPFHVNLDEHVRAVYTVCVLAYFLNLNLARMRSKYEGTDFLNSKKLYRPFKNSRLIRFKDKKFGWIREEIINPGPDDLKILQQLGFSHLLDRRKFQRSTMKN